MSINPSDLSRMCLLRALDAAKQPVWYRANTGRRRQFLSASDADAYDRGFAAYSIDSEPPAENGPYRDGWFDAFAREEERAMSSLEVDVGCETLPGPLPGMLSSRQLSACKQARSLSCIE